MSKDSRKLRNFFGRLGRSRWGAPAESGEVSSGRERSPDPLSRPQAAVRSTLSLSVFFPAYEDGDSIGTLVTRVFEVLDSHVPDHEVIVVNDGSSDHTGRVLEQLQEIYGSGKLRIVTHPRNLGYGAAVRSGLAAATKDFVFYTDGDGQYDVRELPLLLEACGPTGVWVNGYKSKRADSTHRLMLGGLYNRFSRWLFSLNLRDVDCDFRLIRRSAIVVEHLTSTSGTICVEMVHQLESNGHRATEVPVTHLPRLHGSSRFFRPVPLARTLIQILALFLRTAVVAPLTQMFSKTRSAE